MQKRIKRIQGGAIEFSLPPLPSYEVEGVKILLLHPKYQKMVLFSKDWLLIKKKTDPNHSYLESDFSVKNCTTYKI